MASAMLKGGGPGVHEGSLRTSTTSRTELISERSRRGSRPRPDCAQVLMPAGDFSSGVPTSFVGSTGVFDLARQVETTSPGRNYC